MINKKMNLTLKLNKSLSNLSQPEMGPFTPIDQTLSTPVDNVQQNGYFPDSFQPPQAPQLTSNSLHSNPSYNESDDILTDIDEPSFGSFRTMRKYTLNFTANFDQLVMSVYSYIMTLPTTTPFTGVIPPSGLVSKVANETMNNLINKTSNGNFPAYDYQNVITIDYLKNQSYQPIFLQLIRKRLLELCNYNSSLKNESNKLPTSTSISISVNGGNEQQQQPQQQPQPQSIYNTNIRQSSISNLSLTDANISNYNNNNNPPPIVRSRSSSLNLRKQSLTRNNSYSGNNWLHVGNLNNIRPHGLTNQVNQTNGSTDSLQSMQDYVPQSFINRSANQNNFNSMMLDYQTPPSSNKGSVSSQSSTPPTSSSSANTIIGSNVQIIQNHHANGMEIDDFNLNRSRSISRTSSRNNGSISLPKPLTINTENANSNGFDSSLDSPFMSATTPLEEYGYFMNAQPNEPIESLSEVAVNKISLPNQISLSEKKRDSLKMKRGIH